ncbi:GGDEF domain-containing protein [Azospira oryzae]|uniref:GGDEF domain-containing protein n=1 Tax=Azospira oryzae TaxID=146939 RepID=UPI00196433A7|nr:GGDEF domain-containing protein [Azospira oryzae]
MKLKEAFLWQPNWLYKSLILIGGALLVTAVGYVHTLTGLAYEFHAFFIVPILGVSWFLGARFGYALALLAAIEWFLADQMLTGAQSSLLPLLFNTVIRLAIFAGGAWLVGSIRNTLLRESRLAREDALTKLPNRREFLERGHQAFAQAQRQGAPFAAVYIDLDRFKEVNDTLGHEIGDRLLRSVAAAMRAHVRASDVPGRLGGDEFALLLPNMKTDTVQVYVEKLRLALLDAMQAERWPVTFSIGVASYRTTPPDFDALLKQADELMYEVKRGSRDSILLREY